MKYKILTIFLFSILLIGLVNASLGTFKQNECVNIKTILNTSTVTLSTLSYPNSTLITSNKAMTKNLLTFNYTYCNTTELGTYIYDYYDAEGNVYVNDFIITYTGKQITSQEMAIYIIALIFLVLLMVGLSILASTLPSSDTKDEAGNILNINWLKYIRPIIWMIVWILGIACYFILANIGIAYLSNAMIGNLFFKIFQVLFWLTIAFIPIYFIYLIARAFKDKELQSLIERGVGTSL